MSAVKVLAWTPSSAWLRRTSHGSEARKGAGPGSSETAYGSGTMIRHGWHVVGLVSLLLILVGCGTRTNDSPASRVSRGPGLGVVLACTSWAESCERCAGVAESRETTPGVADIGVIIHVMLATVDQAAREKEYEKEFSDRRRWAIAPVADAVRSRVRMEVFPKKPAMWVDFWTPRMVGAFFGRNGRVNEIWRKYDIQLTLLGVEDCTYQPELLRPDGLRRDSMPTPQTTTPWTSQFFRSINRLFTEENPNVLHIFLWWSVAEGDIDDANAVTLEEAAGNNFWGYSRSAARGGPAVWVGAYGCLTPQETLDYEKRCSKVVAHEVGHALGLQHVEEESDNLMYKDPAKVYKDANVGVELSLDQRKQAQREAREQFRAK